MYILYQAWMTTSGIRPKRDRIAKSTGLISAMRHSHSKDPNAFVVTDPDARDDERFVCLGADPTGRVIVTVYIYRGDKIRLISARSASPGERRHYEEG